MIGQALGHYRILDKLGAGGMGEVYLAEDTRLSRKVAVKVLPSASVADPDHLARFEREARVAAALNHPHIAVVYDVGVAQETRYIVQEYLEGTTLRELLCAGPVPLKRAVALALEIAEALAAAHSAGIVHRDLKPENIFVTREGHIKILDFGLAKLIERVELAGESDSTLLTPTPRTSSGQILGTAGYMVPEQIKGQPVDARADVFGFGCVAYEMLAGKPPFAGRSGVESLHRILHEEPDPMPDAARISTPLKWVLRKCLAKDPGERYQGALDLAVDLRHLRSDIESGTMSLAAPATAEARAQLVRAVMPLPDGAALALGERPALAISPDGSRLVYVAKHDDSTRLYVRTLDRLEPAPLPGTEGAKGPFFSPDGRRVGFFAGGKLKIVAVDGGAPLALCDSPESRGAAWGDHDAITFAPSQAGGLWQIPATGGKPRALTSPDLGQGEATHRWPEVLPGGEAVLYTVGTAGSASYDEARIAVHSLRTGEQRVLIEGGTHARYAGSGHLVFVRAATLMAVPFDLARLEVTGQAEPLLEGVLTEATGAAQWTFSARGTLVYVAGGLRRAERNLVWVDRKGKPRALPIAPATFEEPRLSPDGRRLAVGIRGAKNDVWICEVGRRTVTRLTFVADNFSPIWTPDGKRVAFSSDRDGPSNIFCVAADGSGQPERLLASECDQVASSFSRDGRMLAFTEYHPETGADIWILPLKGQRAPRVFLRTPFNEWGAMFSPDGRWLAYASDESGRPEIYVQALAGPGRKWQISNDGGTEPMWARNGRALFYRSGEKMMTVAVTTKPAFRVSKPRALFSGRYLAGTAAYLPNYDVAAGGQRFLAIQESQAQPAATELHLVVDWFAELAGSERRGTRDAARSGS